MDNIDLEAVRLAMFAHPGVKAVDNDVRPYWAANGRIGVVGTISLAAPDVDQATVRATIEAILWERFGIAEVALSFKGGGASRSDSPRGPLEKM